VDDLRKCYKCGYETGETVTKCPKCGRGLLSTKQVRQLGWVQVIIGLFLVVFMGIITFNLAPSMLEPGVPDTSGSRFTGTREQARIVLGLFGVIIVFGLTSIAGGLWQITFGTRNKWILYFGVVLFLLLMLFASTVENVLG